MSCTPESFRRPVFLATLAVFSSLTIAILSSAVASAQATADRSRDDQPGSRQLDDQPPVADPRQRPAAVDETQSAEATIDPTRRGSEGVDQSADAGLLLTDADRVSWLAAQLEDAAELNAYAVERLSDSKVEDFAKQNSDHLKQQATVARQAAVQRSDAAWQASRAHAEDAPDLSDTIGEIGDAVRDRLRERAASDNRARPAFEGQAGNREAVDARLANRRADRDDRNLAQPNSDSSRLERRRSARERLGVLLPAVREELPEMLEMLAEAIEDESTDTAAWVDHQTKIADRILEAKKEELARYRSGERFDQAYLGMFLVSAVELHAAAKAVAEGTDQTLHSLLKQTAELLAQQADDARRLMEQQYSRHGNGKADDRSPQARRELRQSADESQQR